MAQPREAEGTYNIPPAIGQVDKPRGPLDTISYDVAERYVRGVRNSSRSRLRYIDRRDFRLADQVARARLADELYDVSPVHMKKKETPYNSDEEAVVVQRLELVIEAMMRTKLLPISGDIDFGMHFETESETNLRRMRDSLNEKRIVESKTRPTVLAFRNSPEVKRRAVKLS